ncbi:hypothetical protein AB0H63_21170 [Micromonospora echinospora]|uniref:hypothetical protein n=1 Tax=Micromonospora echinospora TaxID=1877 RepID=UPI0033EA5573
MLGFRSIVTTRQERGNLLPLVREQLEKWMAGPKGWDPAALEVNRWATVGDGVRALLLQHKGQDGSASERVRIVETKLEGQWITQLTAHSPHARDRSAWAWIDIEAPDPDREAGQGRPRMAGTPRFVAPILDVVEAWDGAARLTTRPMIIRGEEADEVYRALLDPERRGVVFVAGSDESLPLNPWADLIGRLTQFTKGLAACYVLDGAATRFLNDRLGAMHAVAPGRLRTYRSQVQPDVAVDALRHRVLSTERILDDREHARLARVLASSAQVQALEQPLQPAVARVHRMLERIADELLVNRLGDTGRKAAVPAVALPPTTVEPSQSDRRQGGVEAQDSLLVGYLKLKVGLDELTADRIDDLAHWAEIGRAAGQAQEDVASRLAQLQAELEEVRTAHRELVSQLEDEQLENREAVDLLTRAEETNRKLRHQLASAGQAATAWTTEAGEEDVARPDSFGELLRWITKLEHVEFTGDPDCPADLDGIDTLGAWASKTWDALLVLEDYATAKADGRWDRDVQGFLQQTPAGCHVWPARRHARDESGEVRSNPAFWRCRVLPVPASVDASGEVFMGAHFKIASFAMVSPRMHYYDDTVGSGRIYVGYIGRHLPTGQTN